MIINIDKKKKRLYGERFEHIPFDHLTSAELAQLYGWLVRKYGTDDHSDCRDVLIELDKREACLRLLQSESKLEEKEFYRVDGDDDE